MTIEALLFDKDGTLFDFVATWNGWTADMLLDLAAGDEVRATALGGLIGYDFPNRRILPGSPVIAGTSAETVALLMPALEGADPAALVARLDAAASEVTQVPVVPLDPLMERFAAMGLRIGLATNDAEVAARAHLRAAGLEPVFDFVVGYDSGHGPKPGPGMCLAFARAMGLDPARILMVGDSTHDLEAGRAAGMRTAAVLTGLSGRDVLAPLADVVVPDISHLPEWLAAQSAAG